MKVLILFLLSETKERAKERRQSHKCIEQSCKSTLVGDKYESRQRYFEDVYDMHKSYLIIYNYINLACLEFVILAYNL